MARPKGNSVPSYRLHKQSGQAVVTLSGKDFLLGRYGSEASRREYDRLIGKWFALGKQWPDPPRTLTIAALVKRFMAHADGYYRKADGTPTREASNFAYALKFLEQLYDDTPAREFSPCDLRAVRDKMIRSGLARTLINRLVNRIRRTFQWAVSFELMLVAVHQALKTVEGLSRGRGGARESDPVKPAPQDLVDAVLPLLSPTVRTMVLLQSISGMRSTELCTIRGCDIDMTSDPKTWTYRPPDHKTAHHGHDRQVFLGPRCQELIQPYLKTDLQAFIFSPADVDRDRREALSKTGKTPLSCGNRPGSHVRRNPRRKPGQRYTANSYRGAIARACRKAFPLPANLLEPQRLPGPMTKAEAIAFKQREAKRDGWRKEHHFFPHRLRHNVVTWLRREFNLEAAGTILGHKSVRATEIYAEKNTAEARRIMSEVG